MVGSYGGVGDEEEMEVRGRDFVRAGPESPRAIAHLIPDVVSRDKPFLIADSSSNPRPAPPPGTSHPHPNHDGTRRCLIRI